jgi:hypothetical protein
MLVMLLGLISFCAGVFTGDSQWFVLAVILLLLGAAIELMF